VPASGKDLRSSRRLVQARVGESSNPQGVGVSLLRQRVQFREAFEEHLQMSHNNISGQVQMAMMVQLCVKHSQIHPKDEACPLCALKLSVEEMRDHIASHLERLY